VTSHAIEATEDQERCQLLRSVSANSHVVHHPNSGSPVAFIR